MIQGRIAKLISALLVMGGLPVQGSEQEYQAVPGEYVVVLNKGAQNNMSVFRSSVRAQSVEALNQDGDMLLVKKSFIERPDFAMAEIQSSALVRYVEPNYIYYANFAPNDPLFTDLWGLSNVGQKNGTAGLDVGAMQAWELTKGSQDIIVGVIDTGIDYTHPDLVGNMWVNEAELNGQAGVDDDGNGYVDDIYGYDFANNDGDPMDDHNHGTHVAGTIGATGNDGVGIVGVAWNVRLMALKFLTGSGSGTLAGAIKAIDYATEMGAHLTNNSWGGGGFSQALYDAIGRAKDKGQLFVAAAGNESRDNDSKPGYPASYDHDNIISVAAVDRSGSLASFSNFGARTVDVAAPGVEILSSIAGGEYKEYRGTSMASPHVAGVAALLFSLDPNMSWQEVKDRIVKTAKPLTAVSGKTVSGGMVNAYYAMTNQLPPPDMNDPSNWKSVPAQGATPQPYPNNYTQEWEFEMPGATRVSVYFDRFETETNYDVVKFYDRSGQLVATWSGLHNAQFSPAIPGDYVKVVFTSDENVNRFGILIGGLAYDM